MSIEASQTPAGVERGRRLTLGERYADGAFVVLYASEDGGEAVVSYRSFLTGEAFTCHVPEAEALEAFRDPVGYRARIGSEP